MKTLIAILFILGSGWALLAWAVLLMPVGIFIPSYRYDDHAVSFSLIAFALALAGYWIWFGWGFRWKTGRYPLVSSQSFWILSVLVHWFWAWAIPYGYEKTLMEFWTTGGALPFRSWIAINVIVGMVALFVDPTGKSRKASLS